ncbi:hypothetical protein BJX61DRAFT_409805 [Aspergillus egyptiacus]|nr:hypothetical protein BJX61DRAFT_409805 [Aspergillus egyptiacus]
MRNMELIPSMMELQKRTLQEMKTISLTLKNNVQVSSQITIFQDHSHYDRERLAIQAEDIHTKTYQVRRTAVARKYQFYCRKLGLLMSASFSLTRGTGCFSIVPSLRFHAPVFRDGQNFGHVMKWIFSLSEGAFVDLDILELQQDFSAGTASPLDIGSDGHNRLHVRNELEYEGKLIDNK